MGPDERLTTPSRGPASWARRRTARFEEPGADATATDAVAEKRPTRQAELAHWGLRFVSFLIDFVAPFVIAGILLKAWAPAGVVAYVVAAAFVIWDLVVQGITGQTVGKRFVGTCLVRLDDGEVVGPGLSILRYFGHILDVLPLYAGFLWPLWDDKRQTFSDKMCRTVVIVV